MVSAATIEHFAGGGMAEAGTGVNAKQMRLVEPFGVDFDESGNYYIVEYKGQGVKGVDISRKTCVLREPGKSDTSAMPARPPALCSNESMD